MDMRIFSFLLVAMLTSLLSVQQVDYSVGFVPEELGIEFTKLTSTGNYICLWGPFCCIAGLDFKSCIGYFS